MDTVPFPKPTKKSKKPAWAKREKLIPKESCEICGSPGSYLFPLVQHHIKTRGSGGGSEPSNLITLCVPDHQRVHSSEISKDELIEIKERM
jgi:5-methylcytosine-specific restriction endonuclease McrA